MKHYALVLHVVEVLKSVQADATFSCLFFSTLCHPCDTPAEQEQNCTVDPAEGNQGLQINHLPGPIHGHPQCSRGKCNIDTGEGDRGLLGVAWAALQSHRRFTVLGCTRNFSFHCQKSRELFG